MLPTLAVCASFLSPQLARPPAESRAAPQPRCSVALALTLGQQPRSAVELLQLAQQLLALEPTPLAVAQLTDAIDYPRPAAIDDAGGVMPRLADALKRQRRAWLLVALLREDRDKYVETVSFLKIPRDELPNRQASPHFEKSFALGEPLVEGLNAEGLVPDCALEDVPMGENPLEAHTGIALLARAGETGVSRNPERSIRGLIDEMRRFMLSAEGVAASSQQEVLVRTLRTLMTPVLPPFYRIFMGGLVPRHDPGDSRVGADPKWLADGVQWVRARLPFGRSYLEPGRQLGPWFYAPALTAVVAPYAFGFLVGPASLNRRADGEVGGLVVEKCKFLQESSCKGTPLRLAPPSCVTTIADRRDIECQWSFGEAAPPPDEDPTWPKGCVVGCTSREAMRELSGGGPAVRACE
ncbi:hypothetical protein EMIHUDRAFT_225907 [Emiliania huxleyi CCMP1516]|uniref:Uncharacterized protein n=2 Tax=Emiliania huxleyi TaxID=2903 RepID=A0A0D3KN54_EMIH1|nr:hypothetical protein EMIHUDRAFT_225907 [Emiliania huxleyi CCMP1516]EOD37189.1 hypothetical protein EMIHUDRAFT_225907 [Emiliania huxleyi CCMP1516]|eukprot:XP_005789618.1 hypothetical protein EMIHUDRAFT_225907 [Emiliania huxleyi CCMP1516]